MHGTVDADGGLRVELRTRDPCRPCGGCCLRDGSEAGRCGRRSCPAGRRRRPEPGRGGWYDAASLGDPSRSGRDRRRAPRGRCERRGDESIRCRAAVACRRERQRRHRRASARCRCRSEHGDGGRRDGAHDSLAGRFVRGRSTAGHARRRPERSRRPTWADGAHVGGCAKQR